MKRFPRIFSPLSLPISVLVVFIGVVLLGMGLFQNSVAFSTIGVLLYARVVVIWWQVSFNRLYRWKKNDVVTTVFALWATSTLIFGYTAAMLVWYTYTPGVLWSAFLLTAGMSFAVYSSSSKNSKAHVEKIQMKPHIHVTRGTFFAPPRILALVYLFGFIALITHMHALQVSNVQFSPWQSYDVIAMWGVFGLTCILGIMVFSRFKTKVILLFIILHSFLFHAAIPLSHTLPIGGDVYRMMGSQQQLMEGGIIRPVLFPHPEKIQVFGLQIPRVFVQPHKYVYAQLWAYEIGVQKIFGVSLFTANRWLIVLLWSVLIPLLLYRLGRLLFTSPRYGIWLAALSVVPFSFQALGGLSLAISIGFISFVWSLVLLLLAVQGKELRHWVLFALQSVWLFFAHPVYIVVLLIGLVSLLFVGSPEKHISAIKRIGYVVAALGMMCIIPVLEFFAGISSFGYWYGGSLFTSVKQLVGLSSGWFYASLIRSHDILPFNLLFNHTPDYAFAALPLTSIRWHVLVISIFAILLMVFGVFRLITKETERSWWLIALLSAAIIGGYSIGWFAMDGDHSFVRRLDPLVVLCSLLLIVYAIARFFSEWRIRLSSSSVKGIFAGLIIVLSAVATTSLASGPDLRTMNETEYALATYIDQQQTYTCILADTWPLLALEATSGGAYIGGNFPIGTQHEQPEREALLEELYLAVSPRTQGMLESFIPEGEFCLVALQKQRVDTMQLPLIASLFMSTTTEYGAYYIWEYDRRLPPAGDSGIIEREN